MNIEAPRPIFRTFGTLWTRAYRSSLSDGCRGKARPIPYPWVQAICDVGGNGETMAWTRGMQGTRESRSEPADVALRCAPAALFALLAGCVSYSYVDDRHVQHVVGIVDVAVGPANASPTDATASGVSVTSIGIAAYSRPDSGSGVVLGYSEETFLLLPRNSCVDLNGAGFCAAQPASPAGKPNPQKGPQ